MMKKLLILDIDETLLHSTYEKLQREPEFCFKLRRVYVRPQVNEFLEHCFQHYEVAVWTSAKADYAKYVLKKMVGDLSKFKFIYTRSHCQLISKWNGFMNEEIYLKDLTRLKDYAIQDILIIDDNRNGITPVDNLYHIEKYRGEDEDNALMEFFKSVIS